MSDTNVIPFPGQGLRNMYGAPKNLYGRELRGELARAINLKTELNLPGPAEQYITPVVWDSGKLLYADELADELERSRAFVYAMKKAGFQMPDGLATLTEARQWLSENPEFSRIPLGFSKGGVK